MSPSELRRWYYTSLNGLLLLAAGCAPQVVVERKPFGVGEETIFLPKGTELMPALERLVQAGLLPEHPDNPNTVDTSRQVVADCAVAISEVVRFPTENSDTFRLPEVCNPAITNWEFWGAVSCAFLAVGIGASAVWVASGGGAQPSYVTPRYQDEGRGVYEPAARATSGGTAVVKDVDTSRSGTTYVPLDHEAVSSPYAKVAVAAAVKDDLVRDFGMSESEAAAMAGKAGAAAENIPGPVTYAARLDDSGKVVAVVPGPAKGPYASINLNNARASYEAMKPLMDPAEAEAQGAALNALEAHPDAVRAHNQGVAQPFIDVVRVVAPGIADMLEKL